MHFCGLYSDIQIFFSNYNDLCDKHDLIRCDKWILGNLNSVLFSIFWQSYFLSFKGQWNLIFIKGLYEIYVHPFHNWTLNLVSKVYQEQILLLLQSDSWILSNWTDDHSIADAGKYLFMFQKVSFKNHKRIWNVSIVYLISSWFICEIEFT